MTCAKRRAEWPTEAEVLLALEGIERATYADKYVWWILAALLVGFLTGAAIVLLN